MTDHAEQRTAHIIAQQMLGIEVTEPRGRDHLDFHDLHVGRIKGALRAAYRAGQADAKKYSEQTPSAALMEAIDQLGFLNTHPTSRKEKDEQIDRIHRWYTTQLRPALTAMETNQSK